MLKTLLKVRAKLRFSQIIIAFYCESNLQYSKLYFLIVPGFILIKCLKVLLFLLTTERQRNRKGCVSNPIFGYFIPCL